MFRPFPGAGEAKRPIPAPEMTLTIPIPGRPELELDHLLLDVNGTLSNRGALLEGTLSRVAELRTRLTIHLVSADTFGTLESIAARLGVRPVRAQSGADKLRELDRLGRERCAVIGNGANDVLVLEAAALGFAVLGPEGTCGAALRAADVVCASAADALDLLLEPKALSATLRP
jgi:soluble P-type ATPase